MESSSREQQLASELLRTEYVWGNHIHNLCHGLNPERTPGVLQGQFKGTAEERIFAIFKIMDHEVRHIRDTLRNLGIEVPQLPANHEELFDQIAKATGITENGSTD